MPEKDVSKEVRYLNKDFKSIRNGLIDFAKNYFPTTYKDFNETSVGMMFLEMGAYVGDVLSYYIDDTLKENLLLFAEEEENIIALSQALGYRPNLIFPATTTIDVYQLVPATGTGLNIGPNYDYALIIDRDMQVASQANSNVVFRTLSDVNFRHSSSTDLTEVQVYELDGANQPAWYLLKKSVEAVAGQIKTTDIAFTTPTQFQTSIIFDENIIDIIDAYDSDGNRWYHVPYLAQDTVFEEVENIAQFDSELAQYNETAPYLLKLRKTARRFTSRIRGDKRIELQFGAGVSDNPDELIIPNPANIGNTLFERLTFIDNPLDPTNFMYTQTYGLAPQNTTITVRYTVGGGVDSNVNSGDLTGVTKVTFKIDESGLTSETLGKVKDSIATNNPDAARGGRDGETVDEIRHNALANFPTQMRAVTKEDYITRVYAMPGRFGSIAKVYMVQDDQISEADTVSVKRDSDGNMIKSVDKAATATGRIPNPLALNFYVLGYDKDGKLSQVNLAVKENLRVYLGQYRMLTDAINIKDGFIINIGIKFQIIAFKNYNKREVVLKCIDQLKKYFNTNNWQFNQPIVISDIQKELFSVEGVQSVVSIELENKWKTGDGYSGNIYDLEMATKDNIIYPSLDPSIFEIKYPNKDIEGRSL